MSAIDSGATKKKARTGRAFLVCGILAEDTQQGAEAVLMIPRTSQSVRASAAFQGGGHVV